MIKTRVVLDGEGAILGFDAAGHALKGARGYDIVCAAFSVLVRTAYRSLEALPGVELEGSAEDFGLLSFEVLKPARDKDRAAGIADFLVVGIGDLARDYPESVALTIERYLEE